MDEIFKERLGEVLEKEQSIYRFAKESGVNEATLRRYLKGDGVPNVSKLVMIAKAAGVTTDWLTGMSSVKNEGNKSDVALKDDERKQEFSHVPLVSTRLSAGDGAFVNSENIVGYYAFRQTWLKRIASAVSNLVLVVIRGTSMAPMLLDRDFVMIDTGRTTIHDDLIYAIRVDDTVMVKRLRHRMGSNIQIVSDNREEYEPYQAKREEVHVIGQIIWSCRTYSAPI